MELETAIQTYMNEMNIRTNSNMKELKEYALCKYNGIEERIKLVKWLLEGRIGLITSLYIFKQELDIDKVEVYLEHLYTPDQDIFCPFTNIIKILDKKGVVFLPLDKVGKAKDYIKFLEEINEIVKPKRNTDNKSAESRFDLKRIEGL